MARNLALGGYAREAFRALGSAHHPLHMARDEAMAVVDVLAAARIDDWLVRLRDLEIDIANARAEWETRRPTTPTNREGVSAR